MSRNIQIGDGYHNVAMPGKGAPVLNQGDTYTISDVDFASMQSAGVVGPEAMIVDLGYVDTGGGGGGGGGITAESDPIATAQVTAEQTRAQAAESANSAAVTAEASRAQAQEALMAHVTALTAETSRAQAAEALLARIADLTAEAAARISDVDVEEAARIADVNAEEARALAAEAAFGIHGDGPIANRPANGAVPNGSTWYADDFDGGQLFKMIGGVWVPRGPAVNDTGLVILDNVELAGTFNSGNLAANADTPITGLQIAILAEDDRPLWFRSKGLYQPQLGAAASPQNLRNQPKLQQSDGVGGWTTRDTDSRTSMGLATGQSQYQRWGVEYLIEAPVPQTVYTFRITSNVNVLNAAFVAFGRSTGCTSNLQCIRL